MASIERPFASNISESVAVTRRPHGLPASRSCDQTAIGYVSSSR